MARTRNNPHHEEEAHHQHNGYKAVGAKQIGHGVARYARCFQAYERVLFYARHTVELLHKRILGHIGERVFPIVAFKRNGLHFERLSCWQRAHLPRVGRQGVCRNFFFMPGLVFAHTTLPALNLKSGFHVGVCHQRVGCCYFWHAMSDVQMYGYKLKMR